ncbi:MAG: hypothetical protein E5W76_05415 [Mesorhizobium sp.]|nr:MAG: hypothetical protein E5W76_05415 [Mesorhizobium sp.]
MAEKAFPTGAVLSVVVDVLVSENHMQGVYEVLGWMTGESLYTHQLPRVGREATPVILALHPELEAAVAEAEQVNGDNWREWLATWKARYGETITVPLLTIEQHERIDPVSELAEMVPPEKLMIVEVK